MEVLTVLRVIGDCAKTSCQVKNRIRISDHSTAYQVIGLDQRFEHGLFGNRGCSVGWRKWDGHGCRRLYRHLHLRLPGWLRLHGDWWRHCAACHAHIHGPRHGARRWSPDRCQVRYQCNILDMYQIHLYAARCHLIL